MTYGVEWMDIVVSANYVSPGGSAGAVGLDGDRVGFALAAKGVIRDSTNWRILMVMDYLMQWITVQMKILSIRFR